MIIKLTDKHFVNLDGVLAIEFREKGEMGAQATFQLLFRNSEYQSVDLIGADAEEAFANWNSSQSSTKNP